MADTQQIYFTTLTAVGEAKDAKAKALGTALKFTAMAVGDGNGALPVPDRTRTALVREVRRAAINTLKQDPQNPAQLIAEQVIPENEGGYWIRELGLYDEDGDLFAIANCPETYKPVLAQGSGRTQVVRMVLVMTSAASVQLKIDPSVVLATRQYVDGQDAAHAAAADPHPQYLTEAEGQARIAAAVAALVNSSPVALDTLAELAAALNNDKDFAATMTAALAQKLPVSSLGNFKTPIAFNAGGAPALVAADAGKAVVLTGVTAGTVFLPALATVPDGAAFMVKNESSVAWSVAAAGIDGLALSFGNGAAANIALLQDEFIVFVRGLGSWRTYGTGVLKTSGGFAALKAPNGYQKLPNGMILQWGQFTQNDTGTATFYSFNLPIAFPTACHQALITVGSQVNGGAVSCSAEGMSQAVVNGYTVGPANSRIYRVFAIGN
jgi:hypothetical protein